MRDSKANELSEAFNVIFQAGTSVNVMLILRAFIPALSWILVSHTLQNLSNFPHLGLRSQKRGTRKQRKRL